MEKRAKANSLITRYNVGNMFIIVGIVLITTLEWHFFDLYQMFTRYGTLIMFVSLVGAFFCYVDIKDAMSDKLFWVMAVTDAIALINLFIIGSNKGCILVVLDFMLVLYLADKVKFSAGQSLFVLVYSAFFFFYWTIDVKGYFKGYNTNYGGLILISGFTFLMVLMQHINEQKYLDYKKLCNESNVVTGRKLWIKNNWWYVLIYLFFVALAFNIISWYRSRTALMGLLALLALIIMPRKLISKRGVYTAITILATAGSVLFTRLYIILGRGNDGEGIQLFYKSLISGRNDIWGELWTAYMEHPITGFGSSYVPKLEFMGGVLEVHNAMLDFLFVHGILVFVPVCGLLIYRILGLHEEVLKSSVGKVVFAAIICTLVTGFFENYYIVQPFALMLLSLFAIDIDKLDISKLKSIIKR